MLKPPSNTKAPKIQRLSVEDWTNGVVTAFDDGRSPLRGLRTLSLPCDMVLLNMVPSH